MLWITCVSSFEVGNPTLQFRAMLIFKDGKARRIVSPGLLELQLGMGLSTIVIALENSFFLEKLRDGARGGRASKLRRDS